MCVCMCVRARSCTSWVLCPSIDAQSVKFKLQPMFKRTSDENTACVNQTDIICNGYSTHVWWFVPVYKLCVYAR